MKYLFFSDIDGTLYDRSQTVLMSTKKDIQYAQSQGVEFVIATGNGHFQSIKKLANELNVRYLILSNGAHIFDNLKQITIYKNYISKHIGQQILQAATSLNLQTMFWDEKFIYFSHNSTKQFINTMNQFMHENNDLIADQVKGDILKIQFLGEKKFVNQVIAKIKHLPINIVRMHDNFVEIINQDVSKGAAIKTFCNFFNVSLQQTASIGDSYNDLEMLQTTNFSYAMANGQNKILKTARFKTEHVLKNGVGKALHDFLTKQQNS